MLSNLDTYIKACLAYKLHSRAINQTASKGEQPFLHGTQHTSRPVLHDISKGIKVIECTSFCLQTDGQKDRQTDGQTDARLIAISPERCRSGDIKCDRTSVMNLIRLIHVGSAFSGLTYVL